MPAGWFQTEFVVASSDDGLEETKAFVEFVMVYEDTTAKFEKFMKHFLMRCRKVGIASSCHSNG